MRANLLEAGGITLCKHGLPVRRGDVRSQDGRLLGHEDTAISRIGERSIDTTRRGPVRGLAGNALEDAECRGA